MRLRKVQPYQLTLLRIGLSATAMKMGTWFVLKHRHHPSQWEDNERDAIWPTVSYVFPVSEESKDLDFRRANQLHSAAKHPALTRCHQSG